MRSFTRSLVRRNSSARRPLQVEALERRQPLAGNVTAQLIGSTLLLTGDALGNQLAVASVPGGRIAVIGNATTVNGSPGTFVTSRPVVSIIANLGAGNDGIGFGNDAEGFSSQLASLGIDGLPPEDVDALQDAIDAVANGVTRFSLPGSLVITMDGGSDVVGIIGTVGGSVTANLGSAPTGFMTGNALMIGGTEAAYASRVGGSVSVVGGAQDDAVELLGTTVVGGVAAALGNGDNFLGLEGSSIGWLTYTGGSGDEEVDAADLRVRYGVSIATGAGEDEVYLHAHDGPQTFVGGSMVVDTGAGADFVAIASTVRGGLSLATGTGADRVEIAETSVGLNAVIDTGAGDDEVEIDLTQVRYSLIVAMGAGNDELDIATTSAFAAYLAGGPGFNLLTVPPPSPTGIRRLFVTQFQMMT